MKIADFLLPRSREPVLRVPTGFQPGLLKDPATAHYRQLSFQVIAGFGRNSARCGVLAKLDPLSSDRRCLGVCVQQLVLRDDHLRVEISHSHPALCDGFHEDEEGARRWTTGMGRVPERFLRALPAASSSRCTVCLQCRAPPHPQIAAIPEQFARSTASPSRTVPLAAVPRVHCVRESGLGLRLNIAAWQRPPLPRAGVEARHLLEFADLAVVEAAQLEGPAVTTSR
jgi:hypothetical protein